MRIKATVCLVLSQLAASAAAQEPTPIAIARLVMEADATKLEPLLTAGLASPDDPTRAAAARVANVRKVQTLLPVLKQTLSSEQNPQVAREIVRAIAMLAGAREIDFLLGEIRRFGTSLDGALASAIARRGPPESVDLYFSHIAQLSSLGDSANYFQQALWARPHLVTLVAARLLGNGDAPGWRELLSALEDSRLILEPGVAVAALRSEKDDFRVPTAWLLANLVACEGESKSCDSGLSEQAREMLATELTNAEPEETPPALSFARELLRRILAIQQTTTDPTLQRTVQDRSLHWLETKESSRHVRWDSPLLKYLSNEERAALRKRDKKTAKGDVHATRRADYVASYELRQPPFHAPTPLPAGLALGIVRDAGCNAEWVGVGRVMVDALGLVSEVDLSKFATSAHCKIALETLIRLSLPVNTSIASPRVDPNFLAVKAAKATPCLDESNVAEAQQSFRIHQVGESGELTPPIVRKRKNPEFTVAARMALQADQRRGGVVVAEAIISRSGCVRDVRLVRQTPLGDLNRAALLAISQWQFEPSMLNGHPVEVIFNLTINFRLGY